MDLVRLQEMNAYHLVNPPLHQMVRAYLKAGKKRAKKRIEDKDFAELAKMTDGQTAPALLEVYRGGRVPKIGEPLWQTTRST